MSIAPTLSWNGRLQKYLMIFRVSLAERLTYRLDFALATILRFLPMLTTILLWTAIYAGSGRSDRDIDGFTLRQMIAYLLLVHISRMFSQCRAWPAASPATSATARSRNISCNRST